MGIRVECDWCRQAIAAGEPYATLEIDGKIGQTSVSEPARVYCGGGRNSCASRVLGVLEGNPIGRNDMGFEWQLVPVEGVLRMPASAPVANVPSPRAFDPSETVTLAGKNITAELDEFIRSRVAPAYKFALPRAGIVSVDQAAAMSDEELLAVEGVGWGMIKSLREWIATSRVHDGLTLAREIYDLLRERLPSIAADDPVHPVLVELIPELAGALGRAEVTS